MEDEAGDRKVDLWMDITYGNFASLFSTLK
jgi:hypothetical protein